MRPVALSIAGTDPSGGAGIPADVKVMEGLGVHAGAVAAAVVVQNTQGVTRLEAVAPDLFREQIMAVLDDLPVAAIKVGVLGSAANVRVAAEVLENFDGLVVVDPVLNASSGTPLLEETALDQLRRLLRRADLVTPNRQEAGVLAGLKIDSPETVVEAARRIVQQGARSVMVKGGHGAGEYSSDYWTDGRQGWWLHGRRWEGETHGSGCFFSAAVAASLALGLELADALVVARAYVSRAIRLSEAPGKGCRVLVPGGWPEDPEDLPWVSDDSAPEPKQHFVAASSELLRFYPIATDAEDARELYELGAQLVQIRIKGCEGEDLLRQLRRTVEIARRLGRKVIVNDYWQAALELGADGVHLGQEDLAGVDFARLAEAGLIVGISARNYYELARGWRFRPSYFGVGSVFATPSKQIDYEPIGVEGLGRLVRLSPVPVVAIGGITLERAEEVYAAGADGIAVISAVGRGPRRPERVQRWLECARSSLAPATRPHHPHDQGSL